jgi:hypothetical protein
LHQATTQFSTLVAEAALCNTNFGDAQTGVDLSVSYGEKWIMQRQDAIRHCELAA